MYVAIVGSRDITDMAFVDKAVADSGWHIDCVVSGGARGVDTLAREWAEKEDVDFIEHPAEWDRYGKSAGYKRNVLIVRNADAVIAVKRPHSVGTQHTINIAKADGKPVHILIVP